MKIHPFILDSPLPSDECIRRLRVAIAERGMGFFNIGDFGGTEQYFGRIEGDKIELRKRKFWLWRNDFAPHLFATITGTPAGSRIEGHFSVGSRVSMFMNLWLVFVGIISGIFFVSAIAQLLRGSDVNGNDDLLMDLIWPAAMLAFGFLLPRIGYYFSYWHARELLDFAKTTLAAREPVTMRT